MDVRKLPKNNEAILVTIGGVSRAGKTTLANLLRHLLGHHLCVVISQDDYPQSEHLIPKIKDVTDWEVPESINWVQYEQDVLDYLDDGKMVIAEGLFSYRNDRLPQSLLHLQVAIEKEMFVARRQKESRWGDEQLWYLEHVWASHFQHGLADQDAYHLDGSKPFPLGALFHTLLKVKT